MSAAAELLACLAWGFALGLAYFAALGWTVVRLPRARRPALLLAGSLVLRLGLLMAGLALVLEGSWRRALAWLAGLLLARTLTLRRGLRATGRPERAP